MSSSNIFEWTRLLGNSDEDFGGIQIPSLVGTAITTGNDGSVYVAGHTSSNFDGETNQGLMDVFVSKLNPDGTKDWTKLIGSESNDYATALTIGNDGSVYVSGFTVGDFEGEIRQNISFNGFIGKLNPDGTKDWTQLIQTDKSDYATALTIGNDGSIYISGSTGGDLYGQNPSESFTGFLSKYDPDGTRDWTKFSFDIGNALTTALDGSIYIGGYSASITKFNPDGTKDWTSDAGIPGEVFAVTTGIDGSIYIGIKDQYDLGSVISKFNSDGIRDWTKSLDLFPNPYDITTGLDGSIYISGSEWDISNSEPYSSNYLRFYTYISQFNSDGEKGWTQYLGNFGDDSIHNNHPNRYYHPVSNSNANINTITTASDGSIYAVGLTKVDLNNSLLEEHSNTLIKKFIHLFSPIDIDISSTSFNENIEAANIVATLSAIDEDASDSHTYTLVSGTGDTDNASFSIEGSNLKINSSPDYETKSSYSVRLKTTDLGGLSYEEAVTFSVNDLIDTGTKVADINESYTTHSKGFTSISGSAPVTVTAYEVGKETTLDSIKDYGGNLHAGDTLENTSSSYKYQGLLDVNGDGVFEGIFTNKVSRRWVTAKVDSTTGQVDFDDNGAGGGSRVVGIYEDPLIAEGASNSGFLSDGVTPAPAAIGATGSDRYIDLNGDGDFDDNNEDRLALNSQVRFQNDLDIDNLSAKHSGDYDGDGIHEVYWKTNDGTAYLRSLMHVDGNIRYANYQNETQMNEYLTAQGHTEIISDIV